MCDLWVKADTSVGTTTLRELGDVLQQYSPIQGSGQRPQQWRRDFYAIVRNANAQSREVNTTQFDIVCRSRPSLQGRHFGKAHLVVCSRVVPSHPHQNGVAMTALDELSYIISCIFDGLLLCSSSNCLSSTGYHKLTTPQPADRPRSSHS